MALRQQQYPQYDGEHKNYPHLVYLANHLLKQQGIGNAPREPIDPTVYESLNLCPEEAEQCIAGLMEATEEFRDMAVNLESGTR